jgi:hypothetical protein
MTTTSVSGLGEKLYTLLCIRITFFRAHIHRQKPVSPRVKKTKKFINYTIVVGRLFFLIGRPLCFDEKNTNRGETL